jgi:hypothetical protein
MLLNEKLEASLDKQTLLEFLLFSKIRGYDWEIHPLHNEDWVKATEKKEQEKFEEFMKYKEELCGILNIGEEKELNWLQEENKRLYAINALMSEKLTDIVLKCDPVNCNQFPDSSFYCPECFVKEIEKILSSNFEISIVSERMRF